MSGPFSAPNSIDIFCKVVDHHGDAGTAWRLCREIQQLTGGRAHLRLFIDDPVTLMPLVGQTWDEHAIERLQNGVEVIPWLAIPYWVQQGGRGALVAIEMFGCDIPDTYRAECGNSLRLIINLEYFSCEAWAEGCHLLESKLDGGLARKYFYMPGLTVGSGGIMSISRPVVLDSEVSTVRNSWLKKMGFISVLEDRCWMSVYTYQTDFDPLLDTMQKDNRPWVVWVFGLANHEQVRRSVRGWKRQPLDARYESYFQGNCMVMLMPFLSQSQYDTLLAAGDWALVRGEDSFAGALLSGRPFLWQLYPQQAEIRRVKMEAFLNILGKEWTGSTPKGIFNDAIRLFNFPEEGSGIEWSKLLTINREKDLPWGGLVGYFRDSCNLTEKLLEFNSRFFQGDIT